MSLLFFDQGEISNEIEARYPGLALPYAKTLFEQMCAAFEREAGLPEYVDEIDDLDPSDNES